MAQVTEQLVWSSNVSITDVTNPENTTSSDDSRNIMGGSADWTFELTNLSQTPTSIVSVQGKIEGRTNADGGTHIFFHKILNGSGTELYSEALALSDDGDSVQSGATRTTSDGSTAWTESDINALRIRIVEVATFTASQGEADHYYLEVVYNVADPSFQPAIKLTSGQIKLTSGKIKITG